MMRVEPATREHAERMAPIMRDEDRAEVRALGFTPLDALTSSLGNSFLAEAAVLDNGDVAAMWGATTESLMSPVACLWMLGTAHVPRHRKALLRGTRTFISHVHRTHPQLECLVDARYAAAVRWVQWAGFSPHSRMSINGVEFAAFSRSTNNGH